MGADELLRHGGRMKITEREEIKMDTLVASEVKVSAEEKATVKTYAELASGLGIKSAALFEARFKVFAAEEGIPIYDYGKVHAFMTAKAKADGKIWCWKPLREVDELNLWNSPDRKEWPRGCGFFMERTFLGFGYEFLMFGEYEINRDNHGIPSRALYQRAVPLPVLITVDKIEKHFKGEAIFLVSDYVSPNPDPFLAVFSGLSPLFVVERWDEPSFRG